MAHGCTAKPNEATVSRLQIQQAAKQFSGGQTALDNLSLEVADGKLLAIVGPSGSGKTTLLRAIASACCGRSGSNKRLRLGQDDPLTRDRGS